MSLTLRENHRELGASRLLRQYKDSTKFKAFLDAFLVQVQELEQALYDCWLTQAPAEAEDAGASDRLDQLGALVGEDRNGRTDADYLSYISARILVNRSSGTAPELTGILASLPDAWNATVYEYWPTSCIVEILDSVDPATDDVDTFLILLQSAKSATVQLHLMYKPDGATSFRFDSGPGFDTGGTFGTTIPFS